MKRNINTIFFILLAIFRVSNASESSPTVLKFSLNSRRNVTGHWIAQVELNHAAENTEAGPWAVDIEHRTTKIKGLDEISILATVTVPPQRPSADYELVPGLGYYKLHSVGKPFQEALDMCVSERSHLVIINSEAEFNAIRNKNKYTWVGVNDLKVTGDFKTIFYEPLNNTGYVKWHPTEPNLNGHCVVVEDNGWYHDTPCNIGYPFVCEQEL